MAQASVRCDGVEGWSSDHREDTFRLAPKCRHTIGKDRLPSAELASQSEDTHEDSPDPDHPTRPCTNRTDDQADETCVQATGDDSRPREPSGSSSSSHERLALHGDHDLGVAPGRRKLVEDMAPQEQLVHVQAHPASRVEPPADPFEEEAVGELRRRRPGIQSFERLVEEIDPFEDGSNARPDRDQIGLFVRDRGPCGIEDDDVGRVLWSAGIGAAFDENEGAFAHAFADRGGISRSGS